MPKAKDVEFAKLIMSKELLSRAQMQRHLDELDEQQKNGHDISLETLLIQSKILTELEVSHLKAPKKRVVHCSKCHTMYRAQEEDIGKKFKCKHCGAWVIVPKPGQTQVRSIKDLAKEEGGEGHKEAEKEVIDTRKLVPNAPRAAAIKPVKPTSAAHAASPVLGSDLQVDEMTLMLGLDDGNLPDSSGGKSDEPQSVVPVIAVPEAPVHAMAPKTPGKPEVTIMVDLDDEQEDKNEPAILVTGDDEPDGLTAEKPLEVPPTPMAIPAQPVVAAHKPPVKIPGRPVEATVMLDLDDNDDDEPALVVAADDESEADAKQSAPETEVKAVKPPPDEIIEILEFDEELTAAKPVPAAAKPPAVKRLEPPVVPPPAAAKPPAVKRLEPPVVPSPAAAKPSDASGNKSGIPKMAESTIMLDLDDDDAADQGATDDNLLAVAKPLDIPNLALPKLEVPKEEELPVEELDEWALGGYGADGAEQVKIETHIEKKAAPPVAPPSEELEEWALGGYGADDADKVKIETHIEKQAPSEPSYLAPQEANELDAWARQDLSKSPAKAAPKPLEKPVAKEPVKPALKKLEPKKPETPEAKELLIPEAKELLIPEAKELLKPAPPKIAPAESTIMLDLDDE